MKLTKTQIILASTGAVVVGVGIFFGLTQTGKGLMKKWFCKSTEPAIEPKADTTKTDIPPEDKGIVAPKPKGMTLVEANALASLVQVTGGRMTQAGQIELTKKINEIRAKLEKDGYKMVQVKTGVQSYTFKAEKM